MTPTDVVLGLLIGLGLLGLGLGVGWLVDRLRAGRWPERRP